MKKILFLMMFSILGAKDLKELEKLCESKSYQACLSIANAYDSKSQTQKAITYYKKACDLNDANACGVVATTYLYGINDIKQDFDKALKYYNKACKLGDDFSCDTDTTITQHKLQAKNIKTLQTKCDQNDINACFDLGEIYKNGIMTLQSKAKAEKVLSIACDENHALSCKSLGFMYLQNYGDYDCDAPISLDKAKQYFKKSCDLKESESCDMLEHIDDETCN